MVSGGFVLRTLIVGGALAREIGMIFIGWETHSGNYRRALIRIVG